MIFVLLVLLGIFLTLYSIPYSFAQLCVSNNEDDIDGDGLLNEWELKGKGMDVNNDNIIDLDLSALGASPIHKDLFLEIDYMDYHKPYPGIIGDITRTFANAPVCNPDGTKGINLHVDLNEQIPHIDSIIVYERIDGEWKDTWSGFDKIKSTYFGNSSQRNGDNSANVLDAKRQVYHYVIFGHTFNDRPNSGLSRDIPAMDLIVSLGHESWPPNDNTKKIPGQDSPHDIGTPDLQEGTLLHELGHNLGLRHGGGDHNNSKPNYFSVMNYGLQFSTKVDNRPLDFSQCQTPPIDENNLNENEGIGNSCPPELLMFVSCPPGITAIHAAGYPIDWNDDGDVNDVKVAADINCDGDHTTLNGYDDWENIKYISESIMSSPGVNYTSGQEVNLTGNQMDLNITEVYDYPLLGLEFNEQTYDDVTNHVIEKLMGGVNEINKTENELSSSGSSESTTANDILNRTAEVKNDPLQQQVIEKLNADFTKLNKSEDIPPQSFLSGTTESTTANDILNGTADIYGEVIGTKNLSSAVTNATGTNTTIGSNTTIGLIQAGNISAAISTLDGIISTMDSVQGGSIDDDLLKIADQDKKLEISSIFNSAINSLKKISCVDKECVSDDQGLENDTTQTLP